MSTMLILRDQYGIHPDDKEFVEEKLREIAEHFRQFKLAEMSALEQVWLIGEALIAIKPKIFEGQWENFCHDHFKYFAQSTIRSWMQLAQFRPAILKKFRPQLEDKSDSATGTSTTQSKTYVGEERHGVSSTKSKAYANTSNLPGIEAARNLIREWMREHRKQKRAVTKKSPPREYCPTCGQFLSKRVKEWMKQHSNSRSTT